MAERRMFAKTIIDSDAFLEMPLSAQALYFHLSMRADDEGFINNPRRIQKTLGCGDDDMKLLFVKQFVIPFDSGVVVIKHWKIHNYIRGDRLKETVYQEERALLTVKENDAYALKNEIGLIVEKPTRKQVYSESSLPYSFEYKIRHAFVNKKCPVCGSTMGVGEFGNKTTIPTIQHNIPISKGGKHELGNISVICRACNASIQDNETGKLNSDEVIAVWNGICGIDDETNQCQSTVSQLTDKCQRRLGKVSLDQDSIERDESKKPMVKKFTPPSLEDVKKYCQERKNTVDAERFVNFYTAKGWMVGKNKMKDWKAAVRTWEQNNFDNKQSLPPKPTQPKPDPMKSVVDKYNPFLAMIEKERQNGNSS